VDDDQDFVFRLFSPKQVQFLDAIGPTTFWKRVAHGEYEVIRDGTRNPKITGRSILKRREGLPPAKYGARKGIRGIPKAEAAA
jgi:hypothetical protein